MANKDWRAEMASKLDMRSLWIERDKSARGIRESLSLGESMCNEEWLHIFDAELARRGVRLKPCAASGKGEDNV